jgi:uncharacterized MAPEG superfamily protein
MTIPLYCLAIVAVLPYLCSWVAGYFRYRQFGAIDNKNPRRQQAGMEGVGARAQAAQANAWESLPFFTAGVVVSHLAGADPHRAATLSELFVATRILHPILYLADLDVLRSLVFVVGLGCVVGLFVISG